MTFVPPNLVPAYPEIFLLVALSALLIADLFIDETKRFLTYAYAQLALVGTAGFLLLGAMGQVVVTFNGSFVDDPLARTLKMISVLAVSFVLAYSSNIAFCSDSKRNLSQASDALEINSRRKISLLLYSE